MLTFFSYILHFWNRLGALGPHLVAKLSQDGAKMDQDSAKMAQDSAKMAQDSTKMAQDSPT